MDANQQLQSVYLLLGPETGKKSAFIKNLQKQCSDLYQGAVEFYRFYPFETEQGEAAEVLRNSSLFAEYRFVLITQAESLSANMVQQLAEYISAPSDDAMLVLASSEYSVHKKLQKAVPKDQEIKFWELHAQEKTQWIKEYFNSQHIDITDDAVLLFLDLVENNTQEMRAAADLFSSYLGTLGPPEDITVTEKEIESFVYHSKRESVFSLFEKIIDRDFPGSLEILKTLQLSGELHPPPFFAGLLWQFRRLLHLLELRQQRWMMEEAMEKVQVLGKDHPVKGKRNKSIYRKGAEQYTIEQVRSVIVTIQQTESMLRDIRTDIHPLLIEMMLYRIIIRSGKPPLPGEAFYGLIGVNYRCEK